MQTAAEIIADAEQFFDREALELQIDYCKTILRTAIHECRQEQSQIDRQSQADPAGSEKPATGDDPAKPAPKTKPARRARLSLAQTNLCNQNLSLLTEALRLQKLLVRAAVDRALGADSPFADSPLPEHDGDLYADYCDRRLMLKPNARPKPREGTRGPSPQPPRPRAEVDTYYNALGNPAVSPSNGNGHLNAKRERAPLPRNRLESGERNTDQQEGAPLPPETGQDFADAFEQWGEQAQAWLAKRDFTQPLPQLSPEMQARLEGYAKTDPNAAEGVRAMNRLLKMAEHNRQQAGPGGARQPSKI